ncbi:unnamed protein product [Phaeothamnion confervicola]
MPQSAADKERESQQADSGKRKRSSTAPERTAASSSSSSSDEGEDEGSMNAEEIQSDTLNAIQRLRDDYFGAASTGTRGLPKIVLVHQFYTVLSNKTAIDREVGQLKSANAIRVFRVPARSDDQAVLATTEYLDLAKDRLGARGAATMEALVRAHTGLYVSRVHARAVAAETAAAARNDGDVEGSDSMPEDGSGTLSALVKAGFLLPRREVAAEDAFWFYLPGLGSFALDLRKGRIEVEAIIKRKMYKEAKATELKKAKLRKTQLPMAFLLRDLVGLGVLAQVETPAGRFYRIVVDAA